MPWSYIPQESKRSLITCWVIWKGGIKISLLAFAGICLEHNTSVKLVNDLLWAVTVQRPLLVFSVPTQHLEKKIFFLKKCTIYQQHIAEKKPDHPNIYLSALISCCSVHCGCRKPEVMVSCDHSSGPVMSGTPRLYRYGIQTTALLIYSTAIHLRSTTQLTQVSARLWIYRPM